MADDVFAAARDRFLESLADNERLLFSPCASADDLLEGLKKLDIIAKQSQKQRGSALLDHIKKFSDRLQPYFEIVDIFIQSNPEYSALVWGALRLVLKLASNYGSFFEALLRVLSRLTETFPQYGLLSDFVHASTSDRLRKSIEAVYVDILQFFQRVVRLFVRKDGRPKNKAKVAGSLTWRPFDSRFGDILEQIAFHQGLVRDELDIIRTIAINHVEEAAKKEHAIAAKERAEAERARRKIEEVQCSTEEIKEALERQSEAQTLSSIQKWISPPDFAQDLGSYLDIWDSDTGHWILEERLYKQWAESSEAGHMQATGSQKYFSSNSLWVRGNLGCGKTILAASVIDEMRTRLLNSGRLIAYYFFRYDSLFNNSLSALRAIMAQILHQRREDRELIDIITFVMQEGMGSHGQRSATSTQLMDLILYHLDQGLSTWLILDGIDECEDDSILVRNLLRIAATPTCKLLLFSRPSATSLDRSIPFNRRLELNKVAVTEDIRVYLNHQMEEFVDMDLIPPQYTVENLTNKLLVGADGMFLWARLMLAYLNSPALTPQQRIRTIERVIHPEGLNVMYDRILNHILQRIDVEKSLAKHLFSWLTFSIVPMSSRQLQEAFKVCRVAGKMMDDLETDFLDFENAVVLTCAGLVERYSMVGLTNKSERGLRFVHLSVGEYFAGISHRNTNEFHGVSVVGRQLLPNAALVHLELARRCLEHLTFFTPAQPFSGTITQGIDSQIFRQTFPFCSYTSPYWSRHLQMSILNTDQISRHDITVVEDALSLLIIALKSFLEKPKVLMAWIEAHYLSIKSIDGLETLSLCPTTKTLSDWADWALQVPRSDNIVRNLKAVCENLKLFDRDMQNMQSQWSENLLKSPQLIWNEVTAFSKSSFLLETLLTKTTTLAPDQLGLSKNSTTSLCTISNIDIGGNLMAVLSIWPSKSFEQRWKGLTPRATPDTLKDVCQNWIGRYQLWEVDTGTSQVADLRFLLSEDEVWLQIRQSLRYEMGSGWKMSFPLGICDKVQVFAILRTLFLLTPPSSTAPAECQCATLPLDHSDRLKYNWSDSRQSLEPFPITRHLLSADLQKFSNNWYTYAISFSANGKYLLFADHEHFKESHLIIFELSPGPSLEASTVMSCSYGTRQRSPIAQAAFHPTRPIVVFRDGNSLCQWGLQKGKFPFHISTVDILTKSLTFSSCGNFVIVEGAHDSAVIPVVIPEEQKPLLQLAPSSVGSSNILSSAPTTVGALEISQFNLSPGHVLRGSVSLKDISTGILSIRFENGITLQQTTADGQQMLKLLSLPKWPGLDQTAAVVKLPSQTNPLIRVILNQVTAPSYDMGTEHSQLPPLLIDRHAGAISTETSVVSVPFSIGDVEITRPGGPVANRPPSYYQDAVLTLPAPQEQRHILPTPPTNLEMSPEPREIQKSGTKHSSGLLSFFKFKQLRKDLTGRNTVPQRGHSMF